MTTDLTKSVPMILREELENYETLIPAVVPSQMAGEPLEVVIGFIAGALDHQKKIKDPTSKGFMGVIKRIELVDRRTGDFLLGRKAKIHFTGASTKGDNVAQDIMTGWVEFYGSGGAENAFEVALSRTLVKIAEDNIGNECYIRKAFEGATTASGGDRVRYLANLDPKSKKGARDSGGSSSPAESAPESRRSDREDAPEDEAPRASRRSGVEVPEKATKASLAEYAEAAGVELGEGIRADLALVAEILDDAGWPGKHDYERVVEDLEKEFSIPKKAADGFFDEVDTKTGSEFLTTLLRELDPLVK